MVLENLWRLTRQCFQLDILPRKWTLGHFRHRDGEVTEDIRANVGSGAVEDGLHLVVDRVIFENNVTKIAKLFRKEIFPIFQTIKQILANIVPHSE